jgi:undecaprenyl-diphosphatase
MLVLAPGMPVWDLAQHVAWLAAVTIAATKGCAILIPVLLLAAWFRPAGLRCVLAAVTALILVIAVRQAFVAVSFVPRPFVTYHFQPLYPHSPDSAFPSLTTSYFSAVAVPAWRTWRPLGWLAAAMTVEVAFGCVYVGVHYGTDVVAGAAIGAGCGLAAWLLFGWGPVAWLVGNADAGLRKLRLRPRYWLRPEAAAGA